MTNWTVDELKLLHAIVTEGRAKPGISGFKKAAGKLGKSVGSCERKFSRMDWESLLKLEYGQSEACEKKPWTLVDDLQLYEMHTEKGYSYQKIGRVMGRTSISCERRFQRNNWEDIVGDKRLSPEDIVKAKNEETQAKVNREEHLFRRSEEAEEEHRAKLNGKVVEWLVGTVKADPDVLKSMSQAAFDLKLEKMLANPDSKFTRSEVESDFEIIRQLAANEIDALGMTYPKTKSFGAGRYVVVGESHGKNTSLGMFKLLLNINKSLKPDYIIHIGNISDDDDEISYEWQKIPNLIVVGCLPELHLLKKQVYQYDVVRSEIMLGNLVVTNQYDHGDFVKKGVGRIDPLTLPSKVVLNTHRHEFHSHCAYGEDKIVMSPGCLCRRHTIRTIKQLIFKNGYPHVRQTHPHGFRKYNKQEQDSIRWEQGLIVVEVDSDGHAYPAMCRISQTSLGHTTSYFGTVYGEELTVPADKRIFFNGDMHCKYHDPKILDIQEQFCDDYKPDIHVNVGDVLDNRGLNHHMGGTSGPAFYTNGKGKVEYTDCAEEIAAARYVMGRMRNWSKESHLIIGNHERFAQDFARQMAQLQDFVSIRTLLDTEGLDINVTDIKHALDMGYVKFIHGDVRIWGGTGSSKMDKVSANYGPNTVMGNIHYPAIRSGCYSVPMTGLLDQEYNEAEASQWMQGFGYADVFEDQCFVTIVTVMYGSCTVAGNTYTPRDCSSWKVPPFKLTIGIRFEEPEGSVFHRKATSPSKGIGCPVDASAGVRKASTKIKRV